MASKTEKTLEYIAGLEPGEKVSVRGLAEALGISEGTAYKSIKAAEAQGLVSTRPKVGTVRINYDGRTEERGGSLAEAARSIGASCLCGAEKASEKAVRSVVIADGSEAQFRSVTKRRGENVLCIIGDRPELQEAAVQMGADILLTGGAEIKKSLLEKAKKAGLCVFTSEQDSFSLLGILNRKTQRILPAREMAAVRDWMQMPKYLYHDDPVRAWFINYSYYLRNGTTVAIVNDKLEVCGEVKAIEAINAHPWLSMEDIMEPLEEGSCVDEETDMEKLAETMVKNGRLFTAVTSNNGLSGFISLIDVVRYYQHSRSVKGFDKPVKNDLRISSDEPENRKRFYTLEIKSFSEETYKSDCITALYSAAAWHAFDMLEKEVCFESGNFYSLAPLTEAGEYIISSEMIKSNENSSIIEVEMFDDYTSYMKCMLTVSGAL